MNSIKGKYAWTVTVGEKGQVVITKQARDIFNIGTVYTSDAADELL